MTTRSWADLSSEVRSVLDDYLAAMAEALDADIRHGVIADLKEWLLGQLSGEPTVDKAQQLIEEAGLIDADDQDETDRPWWAGFNVRGAGERIASTWWAPADERLWLPRALGWGWDLNLGAVAVRLGLIEPDAENVPFESTPVGAFIGAAGLPAVLATAVVAHYAVRGRSLPERLPSHWNWRSRADRWTSKKMAAAIDVTTSVVPAVAAGMVAVGRRPAVDKAGWLALASMMAGMSACTTLVRSRGDRPGWWTGPAQLMATTAGPAIVMLGLAWAGRRAEQQRDLS